MIKLAKQYGITDVGLAKACKRHNIPQPPVGYRARRAAVDDIIVVEIRGKGLDVAGFACAIGVDRAARHRVPNQCMVRILRGRF